MKALILSDIHLEHHLDGGTEFLNGLPNGEDGVECVVLAGDICGLSQLSRVLQWFAERYAHVVYVWGNHECYSHSIPKVRELSHELESKISNLHVLDNSRIQLTDKTAFIGGALWFRDAKDSITFERFMYDFQLIENFRKDVYRENDATIDYLRGHIQTGDIVVTHYLPSPMSISEEFEGHDLNRFFMCDMEDVIKEKQPKLWVHGHTHTSCNYTIFRTMVLCNPLGYPMKLNHEFRNVVVDV